MSNVLCAQCGHEIAATAKFCPSCGASRVPAPPAPAAPAPAAPAPAAPAPAAPAPPATPGPPAAQAPPSAQAAPPQSWSQQPRSGGGGVAATVAGSLAVPSVLVASAAALSFALPGFVYAFGTYGSDGSKATLSFFLALTVAAAVLGTVGAALRVRAAGEDRTAAQVVFALGIFAAVHATLTFLTALGQ